MKGKLYYCLTILLLFSIASISAQAILNKQYDLTVSCGGFDCSQMNITILYPNSSTFINNQQMTDNIYYANYSLTPDTLGIYPYYYFDGTNRSKGEFQVTTTGNILNLQQALLYFLIFVIFASLFFVLLYMSFTIQSQNMTNRDGEIIKINWKKYLKITCIFFSYLFLVFLVWFMWNITYAYAQWYNLSLFFKYLYYLLIGAATVFFPALFVFAVAHYINDKKIDKFIKKTGLPYA